MAVTVVFLWAFCALNRLSSAAASLPAVSCCGSCRAATPESCPGGLGAHEGERAPVCRLVHGTVISKLRGRQIQAPLFWTLMHLSPQHLGVRTDGSFGRPSVCRWADVESNVRIPSCSQKNSKSRSQAGFAEGILSDGGPTMASTNPAYTRHGLEAAWATCSAVTVECNGTKRATFENLSTTTLMESHPCAPSRDNLVTGSRGIDCRGRHEQVATALASVAWYSVLCLLALDTR